MIGFNILFLVSIAVVFCAIPVYGLLRLWYDSQLPRPVIIGIAVVEASVLVILNTIFITLSGNGIAAVLLILNSVLWLFHSHFIRHWEERGLHDVMDGEIAQHEALVRAKPENVSHHANLARAYLQRKRFAEAQREFELVIAMLPPDYTMEEQYLLKQAIRAQQDAKTHHSQG